MHGTSPHVPGLFPPPSRTDAVFAISRFLLAVRVNHRISNTRLAELAQCSDDKIGRAINEECLIEFDTLARLAYYFPDEFCVVEGLWTARVTEPPSVDDRIEEIARQLSTLRKELAQ